MILLYKMVCWGVKGLESWDLFKPGQQIMWIPFIHLLTNKCLVLYRSVRVSVYLNYFSTLSNLQASCFENNTFYLLYKSADSWFPIICCWQHPNLCINSIPAPPVLQLSLRFRSSFEGHVLQKRFFYSKKKKCVAEEKATGWKSWDKVWDPITWQPWICHPTSWRLSNSRSRKWERMSQTAWV